MAEHGHYLRRCWSRIVAVVAIMLIGCHADPDLSSLKAEAEPAILALATFKAINGHYPSALPDAGIALPSTEFGEWGYRLVDGGNCQLFVGDYRRHGFRLSWRNDNGWHFDG